MFYGTADVAVIMHGAHASETCDVDLEGDVLGHIHFDFGSLGRVGSDGLGSAEIFEAFVSNVVNHLKIVYKANWGLL